MIGSREVVRGAAVNDRKNNELSIWEYLAYIGNRYCGPNGQQSRHTKRHPNSYCASALRLYG